MTLRVVPVNIGEARAYIERHHSHLHAPLSGLCAVGVADGDRIACVAVLSRPVSRMLQAQGCAEVTRVASDRTPHAASKCLAALSRAALALGWRRIVSSILLGESGATYYAAGWWPVAIGSGGEWFRESDPGHSSEKAEQPGRKVRFEFGPGALPRSAEVDAKVRGMAGKIELTPRGEGLPLFAKVAS